MASFRVRRVDGDFTEVLLPAGALAADIKEAVAGAVGLAVGTFFIRKVEVAHGDLEDRCGSGSVGGVGVGVGGVGGVGGGGGAAAAMAAIAQFNTQKVYIFFSPLPPLG